MEVAQNCKIMGGSKGNIGETACPPYYWMADMELHEGKKSRHKRRRNRHECGNPPISKSKSWQKLQLEGTIWKCPKSQRVATTQINTGLAAAAAAPLSVSQAESFFVRGVNTAMKMNGSIAGDSTTGRKKFTSRQCAALIGFCGVENWKQVQNNWKKIEKARDGTEVRNIVANLCEETV